MILLFVSLGIKYAVGGRCSVINDLYLCRCNQKYKGYRFGVICYRDNLKVAFERDRELTLTSEQTDVKYLYCLCYQKLRVSD